VSRVKNARKPICFFLYFNLVFSATIFTFSVTVRGVDDDYLVGVAITEELFTSDQRDQVGLFLALGLLLRGEVVQIIGPNWATLWVTWRQPW